jgi:glycosyltransferase involved in cell wall biosynthesis
MIADTHSYDLVHLTLPNNEHYLPSSGAQQLVTVHDLCHIACPHHQTRANNFTLKVGLECAVRNGARFLSVSDSTSRQLIDAYALDGSRIATVLSATNAEKFYRVDDTPARARTCTAYGIPSTPFLLTLSTIEPRKNLGGVIRAFEILTGELGCDDVSLVIAGGQGWKSTEILRAAARNRGRVHLTGYVEDGDLAAIYSAAAGFVYVSHYEGFGFPLLEAMHCGAPVIYGDNSAMPEIVGDAGLAADADDPMDVARQMHRLMSSPERRAELSERALQRAAQLTWERTAELTLEAYEAAIAASTPLSSTLAAAGTLGGKAP